jgi:tRNA (adenine22-N1)-methyltransferase
LTIGSAMKKVKLSPRLDAIAKFIENGAAVIDVGTDHGYIPVYLALNNIAQRIIATDLRKGPLERAKATAGEYCVFDRIEFIQTDGLKGITGASGDPAIDTVILAGLGGETIAAILEAARWPLVNGVRLILQPQSKLSVLSNWIDSNGCAIFDETLVEDEGRIYTVLLAGAGASRAPLSCAELHADRILAEKRDPLLPRYLDTLINKTAQEIKGMEMSDRDASSVELITRKQALEGFIRMRKETEQW